MHGGVPQNKELHSRYEAECNQESKMVKCRLGSRQVDPVSRVSVWSEDLLAFPNFPPPNPELDCSWLTSAREGRLLKFQGVACHLVVKHIGSLKSALVGGLVPCYKSGSSESQLLS